MLPRSTHYLARIVLEAIRFHIPDDLVTEQLRYLRSFEDESLNIPCIT